MAAAGRPSCRWIARDVPRRCLASRRTRTATSGCRPMARGSPSPPRTDVWIYDFARATLSRLTTDPAAGPQPALDARRAAHHLYVEPSGLPGAVLAAGGWHRQRRAAPHARERISSICAPTAGRQTADSSCSCEVPESRAIQCAIGQIRHRAPVRRDVLVKTISATSGRLSKRTLDGLSSNVSGRDEIYVERYPELGIGNRSRRAAAVARSGRVTAGNCSSAAWTVGRCLRSPVQPGRRSSRGARRCCSSSPCRRRGARPYDIAPDGRFVIIRSGETEAGGAAASNLILVQNWFEELKRLVPVN